MKETKYNLEFVMRIYNFESPYSVLRVLVRTLRGHTNSLFHTRLSPLFRKRSGSKSESVCSSSVAAGCVSSPID